MELLDGFMEELALFEQYVTKGDVILKAQAPPWSCPLKTYTHFKQAPNPSNPNPVSVSVRVRVRVRVRANSKPKPSPKSVLTLTLTLTFTVDQDSNSKHAFLIGTKKAYFSAPKGSGSGEVSSLSPLQKQMAHFVETEREPSRIDMSTDEGFVVGFVVAVGGSG